MSYLDRLRKLLVMLGRCGWCGYFEEDLVDDEGRPYDVDDEAFALGYHPTQLEIPELEREVRGELARLEARLHAAGFGWEAA